MRAVHSNSCFFDDVPDDDRDGIADSVDNCPAVANPGADSGSSHASTDGASPPGGSCAISV